MIGGTELPKNRFHPKRSKQPLASRRSPQGRKQRLSFPRGRRLGGETAGAHTCPLTLRLMWAPPSAGFLSSSPFPDIVVRRLRGALRLRRSGFAAGSGDRSVAAGWGCARRAGVVWGLLCDAPADSASYRTAAHNRI
jgi:hypothetical protein